MTESDRAQRLVHAILGFLLGGLVTASILWGLVDPMPWWLVGAGGLLCAVLACCFGETFIEWLKDNWWW